LFGIITIFYIITQIQHGRKHPGRESVRSEGGEKWKIVWSYEGEMEEVEGHVIDGEGILTMKTILTDVKPDDQRQPRIHHAIRGRQHEQTVSSHTVENLESAP
jgi:hypothetical protein